MKEDVLDEFWVISNSFNEAFVVVLTLEDLKEEDNDFYEQWFVVFNLRLEEISNKDQEWVLPILGSFLFIFEENVNKSSLRVDTTGEKFDKGCCIFHLGFKVDQNAKKLTDDSLYDITWG